MLIQLCVWDMLRLGAFPLASPLPSTASLASGPTSFGGFAGTMGLSDFPCPCIIGCVLGLSDAVCNLFSHRQARDLPVSAQGACVHAQGLRPRQVHKRLAIPTLPVSPSA